MPDIAIAEGDHEAIPSFRKKFSNAIVQGSVDVVEEEMKAYDMQDHIFETSLSREPSI